MCILTAARTYLVSTLSVQLLLVSEPLHQLLHELQRDLPVVEFGADVFVLNGCKLKQTFVYF